MNIHTQKFLIQGTTGKLECALDLPEDTPKGIALVAHPHPLYGGTMDNKVVQMLARTFVGLGYVSARMNFRGVGQSEGLYNEGLGETEDMALLLAHMQKEYPNLPVVLSGFSFGTYVQTQLQKQLANTETFFKPMVLVGLTAGKWAIETIPSDSILIHGELDDVVPLQDLLSWARPQDIPVIVIPGCDHLFNRKLHHIRNIITALWQH